MLAKEAQRPWRTKSGSPTVVSANHLARRGAMAENRTMEKAQALEKALASATGIPREEQNVEVGVRRPALAVSEAFVLRLRLYQSMQSLTLTALVAPSFPTMTA